MCLYDKNLVDMLTRRKVTWSRPINLPLIDISPDAKEIPQPPEHWLKKRGNIRILTHIDGQEKNRGPNLGGRGHFVLHDNKAIHEAHMVVRERAEEGRYRRSGLRYN